MKKKEIIENLSIIFNKAKDIREDLINKEELNKKDYEELFKLISFLYQQSNL